MLFLPRDIFRDLRDVGFTHAEHSISRLPRKFWIPFLAHPSRRIRLHHSRNLCRGMRWPDTNQNVNVIGGSIDDQRRSLHLPNGSPKIRKQFVPKFRLDDQTSSLRREDEMKQNVARCVRHVSFAPPGLASCLLLSPTACAVGCTLPPLPRLRYARLAALCQERKAKFHALIPSHRLKHQGCDKRHSHPENNRPTPEMTASSSEGAKERSPRRKPWVKRSDKPTSPGGENGFMKLDCAPARSSAACPEKGLLSWNVQEWNRAVTKGDQIRSAT